MGRVTLTPGLHPPVQRTAIVSTPRSLSNKDEGEEFARVLRQKRGSLRTVHFSAHAQQRMAQRRISLSDGDMASLEGALERAGSKGARDSLVLLQDVALVVNVPHRTVVTAVDRESWQEKVFTQIDSVVIA